MLLEAYNKNLISYEEFLQAQADLRKKYATEYLPQSARPDGNSPKAMDEQKRRDLDRVASLEAQGVISHEQAEKAKERISRNYEKKRLDAVRRFGSQETNQLLEYTRRGKISLTPRRKTAATGPHALQLSLRRFSLS